MVYERVNERGFQHARLYFLDSSPVEVMDQFDRLRQWLTSGVEIKVSRKVEARLIKDEKGRAWFVKRYHSRSLLRLALSMLGRNRAQRVFALSCRLLRAGVMVPPPSAYMVSRQGGQLNSLFICEGLETGKDLRNHYFDDRFESLGGAHKVMEEAAELAARLHSNGYVHYDLKWANFMVDNNGSFYLIDLDGTRRPRFATFRKSCRDVARFLVNAREFGLPESDIRYWLSCYAMKRGVSIAKIEKKMTPYYRKFVRRHRKKYNVTI